MSVPGLRRFGFVMSAVRYWPQMWKASLLVRDDEVIQ